MRWLAALVFLAGCSHAPPLTPEQAKTENIKRLIKSMEKPPPPEAHEADSPEHRLELLAEEAVPALAMAVRYDPSDRVRERSAFVLGHIYQKTKAPFACQAYLEAVRNSKTPAWARAILGHAHLFRDRDGEVITLLHEMMMTMDEFTPAMVLSVAAMTDIESIQPMSEVVVKTKTAVTSPERDIALRYLGRAARRGRHDAAEFLVMCTTHGNPDVSKKAIAELSLLIGRAKPENWRAWWLDHAPKDRRDWVTDALSLSSGRLLDLTNRDDLGWIIESVSGPGDREPEFWLLEQVLDRRFGFVSPRDIFDPAIDPVMVAEGNQRATANLKAWWKETSSYVFYNVSTGRFEINDVARKLGKPVDPRTGKP